MRSESITMLCTSINNSFLINMVYSILCFWTVVLEKTLESPLDCKEIQPVYSEGDQPWVFFGRNDAKAETPVLWPPHAKSWLIGKDWCWEGFGAGGEGDDRGWAGWMASRTWWTWVWVNSGRWWWTGRPGVLWFMGLQRVGHDWVTELNSWWTTSVDSLIHCFYSVTYREIRLSSFSKIHLFNKLTKFLVLCEILGIGANLPPFGSFV